MATIVQRKNQDGSLVWRVQVRRKGLPAQSATFLKKRDAELWANKAEVQAEEQKYFPERKVGRHTLSALIDQYYHEVLPHNARRTHETRKRHLTWWLKVLGDVPLHHLSSELILQQINFLALRLAPNTINSYHESLSCVLGLAVKRWRWLNVNPMSQVPKLKRPKGRVRFLSPTEREQLLSSCRESKSPYLYVLVVLALATGARQRELFKLKWEDIDLEKGRLIFRKTKNHDTRSAPLSGFALNLLTSYTATRRDEYVFPGGTLHGIESVDHSWKYALRRAGISNFRFHDLRHTFASYLAMNGATLLEIAEALGHKQLSMVQIYAHLTESHTHDVIMRMTEKIFR